MTLTPTLAALLTVFVIWLIACIWTGFRARVLWFFIVLATGLALNATWMVFGLDGRVFGVRAASIRRRLDGLPRLLNALSPAP